MTQASLSESAAEAPADARAREREARMIDGEREPLVVAVAGSSMVAPGGYTWLSDDVTNRATQAGALISTIEHDALDGNGPTSTRGGSRT